MDLALFDFDGTLTRSDSFVPFLQFASTRLRWVGGSALLLPVLLAYKLGLLRASPVRAIACFVAFAGHRERSLRQLGADFAATRLPQQVRPAVLERVRWHRERGDRVRVVVVSASLDLYLDPWCASYALELLCTRLMAVHGWMTGALQGGDCSRQGKVERIRKTYNLSEYESVWAYGDTPDDFPMLRLADHKYFQGKEVSSLPGD